MNWEKKIILFRLRHGKGKKGVEKDIAVDTEQMIVMTQKIEDRR